LLRTIGKCLEQNSVHCDEAVAQARRLCTLPIASEETQLPSQWPSCASAVALLQRTRPSLLDSYRPLAVSGDGNCLYRSLSLLLYGTEQFHSLLCIRTAVEVLSNENWYNVEHSACRCPFKDETALILRNYRQFCIDTATDGAFTDKLTVYALSRAIDRHVQLFFPPLCNNTTMSPHTHLLNILKTVANWKQLPATSVINNVKDIVRVQYGDVRCALYGQGNFVLEPAFSCHTVPYTVWSSSDDAQKDRRFQRFTQDNGNRHRITNVVSSDGVTKTLNGTDCQEPGAAHTPKVH